MLHVSPDVSLQYKFDDKFLQNVLKDNYKACSLLYQGL